MQIFLLFFSFLHLISLDQDLFKSQTSSTRSNPKPHRRRRSKTQPPPLASPPSEGTPAKLACAQGRWRRGAPVSLWRCGVGALGAGELQPGVFRRSSWYAVVPSPANPSVAAPPSSCPPGYMRDFGRLSWPWGPRRSAPACVGASCRCSMRRWPLLCALAAALVHPLVRVMGLQVGLIRAYNHYARWWHKSCGLRRRVVHTVDAVVATLVSVGADLRSPASMSH